MVCRASRTPLPAPAYKEALIDIQVALPAAVEVESLSAIHEEIKHEFPLAKKRFFLQAAIPLLEGDGVGLSTRQHRGYSFYSADGRYAFQARLDGFTFGRLSPYDSWQDLRDSAKANWALFEKHARQVQIERVAVRYINQIDIPTPSAKLDEYFLTPPRISPLLPQELSQYLMQVQIPQPDIEGIAVLTQTLVVPPPVENCVSVILDIEIFVQKTMSVSAVWELLEEFRLRKNALFEGSITDKTRELFA